MQFASTCVLIGDAQITLALGYARAAWAVLVERQGFVLDTRFVPAADAVARDRVCVYVLLRGRWLQHGPDGRCRSFERRAAFVVSEAQLEGDKGRRSCTVTQPNSLQIENEPMTLERLTSGLIAMAVATPVTTWRTNVTLSSRV